MGLLPQALTGSISPVHSSGLMEHTGMRQVGYGFLA